MRGLRIDTQQKARADFVLEPGAVTGTVEGVASAVALTTENAALGQVIENKRVVGLPLNGRNMIQLAVMAPECSVDHGAGPAAKAGFRFRVRIFWCHRGSARWTGRHSRTLRFTSACGCNSTRNCLT